MRLNLIFTYYPSIFWKSQFRWFRLNSFDRLLLALALTLYTATAWEPTADDKRYHQQQLAQKTQQVEYSNRRKLLKQQQEMSHF